MKKFLTLAVAATVTLLLSACSGEGGRTRPEQVQIVVVNAAQDYGELTLRRVARTELTLAYRGSGSREFDSDTYLFFLDYTQLYTGTSISVASFERTLSPENVYLFFLMSSDGDVSTLETSIPAADPASSNSTLVLAHAVAAAAAVDIYVHEAGTGIDGLTPTATLSYRETIPVNGLASGGYKVTVTAAGDPATVLYTSPDFGMQATRIQVLTLLSGAGEGTSELALSVTGAEVFSMDDINAGSSARFLNGAVDNTARDIYLDDDFTLPLISALPADEFSARLPLQSTDRIFTVTPVANVGAPELELETFLTNGWTYDVIIAGEAGALSGVAVDDDRRKLIGASRLKFYNTFNNSELIDIYVSQPDQDYTELFLPSFQLAAPGASARTPYLPGEFAITVVESATETVLLGPEIIDMSIEGVYSLVLREATDGTMEMIGADDFLP